VSCPHRRRRRHCGGPRSTRDTFAVHEAMTATLVHVLPQPSRVGLPLPEKGEHRRRRLSDLLRNFRRDLVTATPSADTLFFPRRRRRYLINLAFGRSDHTIGGGGVDGGSGSVECPSSDPPTLPGWGGPPGAGPIIRFERARSGTSFDTLDGSDASYIRTRWPRSQHRRSGPIALALYDVV